MKKKQNMKDTLYTAACGAWIGGTMTVPGVSGGSMAMILGIYDRLITSVNGIFKKDKFKESLIFLLKFMIGAVIGLFLFAKLITLALTHASVPTRYFFLGAVAGGAPMIFRAAKIKKVGIPVFVYPIVGIVCALLISLIPEGIFEIDGSGTLVVIAGILIQLLGGIVIAVALVLPGISVSQMLLVLGVYEKLTAAVDALDIMTLLSFAPLVIGTVGGILLTTNLIERAMKKSPTATYLIVFGFILGSLPELFPAQMLGGWDLLLAPLLAILGFFIVFAISKKENA
jgi:putative membrane protein